MPPVELQNIMNDLIIDWQNLGQAITSSNPRSGRQAQKRLMDNQEVMATKRSERGEGSGHERGEKSCRGHGRGRGNRGGRGRTSEH
jgi:hypothetical protein